MKYRIEVEWEVDKETLLPTSDAKVILQHGDTRYLLRVEEPPAVVLTMPTGRYASLGIELDARVVGVVTREVVRGVGAEAETM